MRKRKKNIFIEGDEIIDDSISPLNSPGSNSPVRLSPLNSPKIPSHSRSSSPFYSLSRSNSPKKLKSHHPHSHSPKFSLPTSLSNCPKVPSHLLYPCFLKTTLPSHSFKNSVSSSNHLVNLVGDVVDEKPTLLEQFEMWKKPQINIDFECLVEKQNISMADNNFIRKGLTVASADKPDLSSVHDNNSSTKRLEASEEPFQWRELKDIDEKLKQRKKEKSLDTHTQADVEIGVEKVVEGRKDSDEKEMVKNAEIPKKTENENYFFFVCFFFFVIIITLFFFEKKCG